MITLCQRCRSQTAIMGRADYKSAVLVRSARIQSSEDRRIPNYRATGDFSPYISSSSSVIGLKLPDGLRRTASMLSVMLWP